MRDSSNGISSSRDGVGSQNRRAGDKVHFVLAGGDFVMARLDANTHLGQLRYDFVAYFGCQVGREIKVAPAVFAIMARRGKRQSGAVFAQEVELQLRRDFVAESQCGGVV